MKVIDLEPNQLPLIIRLKLAGETKTYVLLRTRQDKLLLNKPNGDEQKQSW
jgi:hypothetical protein